MMNPYLIFSDLDGTLTNSQGIVSIKTKQAISSAIDKGHIFYICTGRMIQSVLKAAHDIDPRINVVGSNGGVMQIDNQFVINKMKVQTLLTIYNQAMLHHTPLFLFGLDVILYSHHLPDYFNSDEKNRTSSGDTTQYIKLNPETIEDTFQLHPIANALIISEKSKELENVKAALSHIEDITISSSFYNNIEIIPVGTSKGNALRKIASHNNIDMRDTLAFGDGNNDIEMLQEANVSIALMNATQDLKEVATHIAPSNDEDGFASFLNQYLKGDIN